MLLIIIVKCEPQPCQASFLVGAFLQSIMAFTPCDVSLVLARARSTTLMPCLIAGQNSNHLAGLSAYTLKVQFSTVQVRVGTLRTSLRHALYLAMLG